MTDKPMAFKTLFRVCLFLTLILIVTACGKDDSNSEITPTPVTDNEAQARPQTITSNTPLNKDIPVEYFLKNYKATSQDENGQNIFQEYTSTATFNIKEYDSINATDLAGAPERKNMSIYYVIYEFTGDPDTPKGGNIKPQRTTNTSPEAAPQLVGLISDKTFFYEPLATTPLSKAKDIDSISDASLWQSEPGTYLVAWYKPNDTEGQIAVRYFDANQTEHLVIVADN